MAKNGPYSNRTPRGRYRLVYSSFWSDEKIQRLTAKEKLVALYCLTGPQTNRVGLFSFSLALASEDLGLPVTEFRKALDTVCHTVSWEFEEGIRVLFIPSFFRWNPPPNEKALKGFFSDLAEIPKSRFHNRLRTILGEVCDMVSDTVLDTVCHQEQEQEQEHILEEGVPSSCPETSQAKSSGRKAINDQTDHRWAFPVDGNDGLPFFVPESWVAGWVASFPFLDVAEELSRAASWCQDNPDRRKTFRGMRRFLGGWMDRANERRGKNLARPAAGGDHTARTVAAVGEIHRRQNSGPKFDSLFSEVEP